MNRYSKYAKSDKGRARSKRYKAKNKEKIVAQNRAIFIYPNEHLCHIKGCVNKAERHHPNYQNPDKITWLCRKHHLEIHGVIKGKCKKCGCLQHAKDLCKKHYAHEFRKCQGW